MVLVQVNVSKQKPLSGIKAKKNNKTSESYVLLNNWLATETLRFQTDLTD